MKFQQKSKKKAVDKTLASQKSRVVNKLQAQGLGQRKIKKVKVTKGGGPIYTTSWRSTSLNEVSRKTRRPAVTRNVDLLLPAYRKDHTPLLKILQNKFMHDGRKGSAEKIYFKTLRELNQYSKEGAGFALFYLALERLKPALVTVVRRVGSNYYQVPVPVQSPRQYKMAFQWLLEGARTGSSLPLHQSLAEEVVAILSSSQSEGLKKKEALYKSVVTNRAYSHYRWI